ncbi:MAG: hypothetical protein QXP36_02095 [Conexivisphaerales archaeon]
MHYSTWLINLLTQNYSDSTTVNLVLAPEYPLSLSLDLASGYYNQYKLKISSEPIVKYTYVDVPTEDFFVFFKKYKEDPQHYPYTFVYVSRVLEHIEVDNLEFFVFELSNIMQEGGRIYTLTPRMDVLYKHMLTQDISVGSFEFRKMCYEIYGGTGDARNYHKWYTTEKTIKELFTIENLFSLDQEPKYYNIMNPFTKEDEETVELVFRRL